MLLSQLLHATETGLSSGHVGLLGSRVTLLLVLLPKSFRQ